MSRNDETSQVDLQAHYNTLRAAAIAEEHEVTQTLGKALGFPWYKDDQTNFPGATEAEGVCVGEHVAVTLVDAAAKQLHQQADQLRLLQEWFDADREMDAAEAELRSARGLAENGRFGAAQRRKLLAENAIRAALGGRQSTVWEHIRSGRQYTEVGHAEVQASHGSLDDGATVVIYRGQDGRLWVRQADEFLERFTQLVGFFGDSDRAAMRE